MNFAANIQKASSLDMCCGSQHFQQNYLFAALSKVLLLAPRHTAFRRGNLTPGINPYTDVYVYFVRIVRAAHFLAENIHGALRFLLGKGL